MRVISQDGTLDLPYERIVISLEDNGNAYCLLAFSECTSIGLVIARYSTKEKAKDAMSCLHGYYNEYIYDKYGRNSVDATFQFPADDEI